MPRLASGRHVAVMRQSLIEHVQFGTDSSVYAFIVAYRLSVQKPEDLRDLLPVAYFEAGQGEPPNAPFYASGFLVLDVLAGKAEWPTDEVQEFRNWLETDRALNEWLAETFDAINVAIRDSPIWETELAAGEGVQGVRH